MHLHHKVSRPRASVANSPESSHSALPQLRLGQDRVDWQTGRGGGGGGGHFFLCIARGGDSEHF